MAVEGIGTALVTGGTGGIGLATARGLAQRGATVLIAGRDPDRGAEAVNAIAAEGKGSAEFFRADLSTLADTQSLAERVIERSPSGLDLLINNLGGLYGERHLTPEGFEATFATNVLTPLALSRALLPSLRAAAPSRLVFVNSDAHKSAPEHDLYDFNSERFYLGLEVYGRAKLLQLLIARHLGRNVDPQEVTVVGVSPGAAWTDQIRAMTPEMLPPEIRAKWQMIRSVQKTRTPETAAIAVLTAATDPALTGTTGTFIVDEGQFGEPGERACDAQLAADIYERVTALLDRVGVG